MESAYDAFQEGNRLLASQNPHAAVIALERARDLEPDKGSVRETLARAYFRTGRFTAGRRGVRAGGGDRPGERLRPLRPRPVPAPPRRPARRPPPPQAGGGDAARSARLPGRARRASPTTREPRDATPSAPVVACDLDGVVWRGDEPDPARGRRHRRAARRRAAGRRSCRTTRARRSATWWPSSSGMGVPATPADVLTSAIGRGLAARAVAGPRRPRARVRRARRARGARRRTAWSRSTTAPPTRWSSASTATSTTTASTARRPRCGPGPASSPPTSTRPIPIPGGLIPGAGALVAAVATAAGRHARGRGQARGADRRPHPRALRHHRRDGGRPAVDRRRAGRPRSAGRSRSCCPGSPPRSRRPGGEAIPDPPPPFVAADLGALAPA